MGGAVARDVGSTFGGLSAVLKQLKNSKDLGLYGLRLGASMRGFLGFSNSWTWF